MKLLRLSARCVLWAILTTVIFLVSCQSKIIYHPRPYDKTALWDMERRGGRRLEVQTSQGRQVAFYLPSRKAPTQPPEFLWFVFGGNGSVALDYSGEPLQWDERFGYVFVDYPGYGLCEGNPNPERIRESIVQIGAKVQAELHWSDADFRAKSGVFGHSLGCAAALIQADETGLSKAVLCSPFTTMTDMARGLLGWPLCLLNRHRFDNVSRLQNLSARGFQARVFHGTADEVVAITMSRTLARKFPQAVRLTEVPDCGHNEIVLWAGDAIGKAMLELSGLRPH